MLISFLSIMIFQFSVTGLTRVSVSNRFKCISNQNYRGLLRIHIGFSSYGDNSVVENIENLRPPVIPFDSYDGPEILADDPMYGLLELNSDFRSKDNQTSTIVKELEESDNLILDNIEDNTGWVKSMFRLFMGGPLDSPSTYKLKSTASSLGLLVLLLSTIFTFAYYLFPGSFAASQVMDQFFNLHKWLSSDALQSFFEPPEYSESGGVYFSDDDVPMAKTLVDVY